MRIFFSTFGALIVTVFLFVLMTALIKTAYAPRQDEEVVTTLVAPIPTTTPEKIVKKKSKPKLSSLQSPPASSTLAQKANALKQKTLEESPSARVVFTDMKIMKNEHLPVVNISINAPHTVNGQNSGNTGSGNNYGNNGTGLGLGGTICTMGFTVTLSGDIEEIQWYNCMGKDVSDESEERLHTWLYEHPNKRNEYAQSQGKEILISFDNISSSN